MKITNIIAKNPKKSPNNIAIIPNKNPIAKIQKVGANIQ